MNDMKEFTLQSGAVLKLNIAPFADGRELFTAVMEQAESIPMTKHSDVFDLCKNIFCRAMASPRILKALEKCMEKSVYNNLKISSQTFEPEEARGDYVEVLVKVAEVNLLPFTKSLSAPLSVIMEAIATTQK